MAKLRAYGKIASNSLGEVIKQDVGNKIYPRLVQRAENIAETIAHIERAGGLGFFSVTGNLFASIGVTVERHDDKGKYILSRTFSPYKIHGEPVTRKPLNKYEKYNLAYYYSGSEVSSIGRPYKAMSYGGKMKGDVRAAEYRKALSSAKAGGYKQWMAVYVYATMPYTKEVNERHEGALMETLSQLLKNQFGRR